MATCCSITFVVFTLLVLGSTIASYNLPLFIIVNVGVDWNSPSSSTSSSSAEAADHHSAVSKASAFGHAIAKHQGDFASQQRKHFEAQGLPLGNDAVQCPFWNNNCEPSWGPISLTTDEFLALAGCGDKIGSTSDYKTPRLWSIIASPASAVTFGLGVLHMIRSSNPSQQSLIKFSIAGIAAAHCLFATVSVVLQSRISTCMLDSALIQTVFGGGTLIMTSMLVEAFAAGIMFWCAVGMALSWCCSCCGAPAGNQAQGMYAQNVQVQMINAQYSPTNAYPQAIGSPYAPYANGNPYGNLPPPQNPGYVEKQQYPQSY